MILKTYATVLVLSGLILSLLPGNLSTLNQNIPTQPIEFAGLKAKYSSEEKIVFKIVNRSKTDFVFNDVMAEAVINGKWRGWIEDISRIRVAKDASENVTIKPGQFVWRSWNQKKVPDPDPVPYSKSRKYRFYLLGTTEKSVPPDYFTSPEFVCEKLVKSKKPAKHQGPSRKK